MRRLHEWHSSDPIPALSVVIATANRSTLLAAALEGLVRQSLTAVAIEVIVIDDGSTDDTGIVTAAFESVLPVRYAFQRASGLASARNHGLFLASGEIVLFLDDDDVANHGLLEQHLRTHRLHPAPHDAVLGFTGLAPQIANDPLMRFVTEVEGHLFSYGDVREGIPLDFTHFWGGRTSCKRAFLTEHGVFNPVFRFGCEDIELAYRLSRHGLRVFFNPHAVTLMNRAYTLDSFCERLHRQGGSNYRFSRLHDDPVVEAWTEVRDAERCAASIGQMHQENRRRAGQLDRLARLKHDIGLPLTTSDLHWLYAAYSAACRSAKWKGIIDAKGM